MIQINPESPLDDILPFVKAWIKLIADGMVQDACARLDEPNSYGKTWTPDLIEELIIEYLGPEEVRPLATVVSDPDLLPEHRNVEVGAFDFCLGYWFNYELPLDGEWSDLTAQFEFYERRDGFAVILHDLHVL